MSRDFQGAAATSQIISVEVATGTRQVLTSGPGRKIAPRWLVDGRVGYIRGDENEKPGARQRVNYRSAGIRFTDGSSGPEGDFSSIDWSPDGKRILFYRELESDWPPVLPAFSPDPHFRLVRTGVFPSYSPDGSKLVFAADAPGFPYGAIWTIGADGSGLANLLPNPSAAGVTDGYADPVYSPDGLQILLLHALYQGGSSTEGLALVNADGTGLHYVGDGTGGEHQPDWGRGGC